MPFGVEAQINPYWLTALDYSLLIHNKSGNGLIQGIWDVGGNCFIAGHNQFQVFYQLSNNSGDRTGHSITAQLALVFEK